MSERYNDLNRGVLFKNDRKQSEKHPDYKGKLDVNGDEYEIAAWIKTGKSGKFMSLSIKPKTDRPAQAPRQQQDADDDEIPF